VLGIKAKLDAHLPKERVSDMRLAPQIRKDTLQRIFESENAEERKAALKEG
jgi:hypothetical protein